MLTAFIEFVPPPSHSTNSGYNVRIGVGPGSHVPPTPAPASNSTADLTRMMLDTDLGGADYSITHHPASWTAKDCQALCDGQEKCKAWVWAVRGRPAGSGDCCLKEAVPCPVRKPPQPSESVTSGAKVAGVQHCCDCTRKHCDCPHSSRSVGGGERAARRPPPPITLATATLQLLPTDTKLDLRIFTDNGIVEVYWMDGRVVMTVVTPLDLRSGAVTISTTGTNTTASATAWAMGGIWTSVEHVIAGGAETQTEPV